MKNKLGVAITGFAVLSSLLVAAPAFAQGFPPQGGWGEGRGHMPGRAPGIFGTVSAINGETLSVESRGFGQNAATTTYAVDATNATVFKDGATSTLSSVALNDRVMAQGTVSGTNVAATVIRDGLPQGGPRPMNGGRGGWGGHASSTMPMRHATSTLPQGNGQPVVGGTVTNVSGDTVTLTNAGNVTYTIDATNAAVTVKGQSSTVGNIMTGDKLIVQGGVNGQNITASSIIDQGPASAGINASVVARGFMGGIGNIFGGIGGLFHKLFGFF